jgi:hypothetical protein
MSRFGANVEAIAATTFHERVIAIAGDDVSLVCAV